MIAKDNEYITETMQTLYEYNDDPIVREKCRARETQLFFEHVKQAKIEELTEENANLQIAINTKDASLAEKDVSLAEKDAQINHLRALLKEHNISV